MNEFEQAVPPRGTRDVRVDPRNHPGWLTAVERLPTPGEAVETNEGSATVVRLLGRTGSGGRLLELKLLRGRTEPFFAAAANVLVAPLDALQPSPAGGETAP